MLHWSSSESVIPKCSLDIAVLKNFEGRPSNSWRYATLLKRVFHEYCEIFKNTFFMEHLRCLLQVAEIQTNGVEWCEIRHSEIIKLYVNREIRRLMYIIDYTLFIKHL